MSDSECESMSSRSSADFLYESPSEDEDVDDMRCLLPVASFHGTGATAAAGLVPLRKVVVCQR